MFSNMALKLRETQASTGLGFPNSEHLRYRSKCDQEHKNNLDTDKTKAKQNKLFDHSLEKNQRIVCCYDPDDKPGERQLYWTCCHLKGAYAPLKPERKKKPKKKIGKFWVTFVVTLSGSIFSDRWDFASK